MDNPKEHTPAAVLDRPSPATNFKLSLILLVAFGLLLMQAIAHAAVICPSILNQHFKRLQDGQSVDLCQYAGKVVLVVNTASFCGFTHQYAGLERLYAANRDRGLVVLGFPANDFANQEPGTNQEVATFCRRTYGVAFPMFEKSDVIGASTNPLFKALTERTGDKPQWNFHKYLISRNGKETLSFDSSVEPDDARLTSQIERMLKAEAKP